MIPYADCNDCIATQWCKIYSGEVQANTKSFCSAKFRLEKALQLSEIPKTYIHANRYNYVVTDQNREYFDKIRPYLDNIVQTVDEGVNFFFYSPTPGTGKTYLGAVLLNQYIYKTCVTNRFDFEKPLAMFVVYTDLMDLLRYQMDEEKVQEYLNVVRDVPLLMLDDVGAGKSSEFTVNQTYNLLNHRFNNGLSTIITSNLTVKELQREDVLGKRSVSRIVNNCVGIEILGDDWRLNSVRG